MPLPGRVASFPTPKCGGATSTAVAPRVGGAYSSSMADLKAFSRHRRTSWLRHFPFARAQVAAAVLLAISYGLPYWRLTLTDPARPEGIRLTPHLDDLQGPIEAALAPAGGLGDPRGELAQVERSFDVALATVVVLLLVAALLAGKRWAVLLAVPAICFPLIVIADTVRVLGRLEAGSLMIEIRPGWGFLVAATASLTAIASLWLHFKEYRLEI